MKVDKKEVHGGYQILFTFENGFMLSVINHSFSYGTEAALMKQGHDGVVYDDDKFYDVIGHLEEKDLVDLIQWTSSLPADYPVR